jgi:hypothetical protein
MRDVGQPFDSQFDGPESPIAMVIATAILAAFTLAVALYWPDEQARADQKYATRSNAEHTQVCVNLGFELRSPGFGKCIDELIKLQARHRELLGDHAAATTLF